MIISASRRTDIPTLYAEWLENRVREGFLCVRNPMNAHQVSRISLAPEVVDCIVSWTKNPAPMLPQLDAFSAYPQYFQVTLTGYGRDVEAGLLDKRAVLIPAFQELSRRLGAMRTIGRYDPILFNGKYTPAYHLRAFRAIAQELDVAKDRTQRLECGCAASIDIGAYSTCTNGCAYRYANFDPKTVARARAAYDPAPLLCGTLGEGDVARDRPMRSLIKRQAALGI